MQLSVLFLTLSCSIGCAVKPEPVPSESRVSEAITPVPLKPDTLAIDVISAPMEPLPREDCLKTPQNIRRKVVTIRETVRTEKNGSTTTQRMPLLSSNFVFGVRPDHRERHPDWFEIGDSPTRGGRECWIAGEDVVEWNTRLSTEIISGGLDVYSNKDSLIELATNGRTPEPPIARWTPPATPGRTPWPIGQVHRFVVDGREYEALEIHFLGRHQQNPGNRQTQSEIPAAFKTLTIAFVIDNTRSTEFYLVSMRKAMIRLTRLLKQELPEVTLRFGICLYRDYVDSLMFEQNGARSVTHLCFDGKTVSAEVVTEALGKIATPSEWSDDEAEASLDGLHRAILDLPWGPEFGARAVVWVSDAPFHSENDPKNPQRLSIEQITKTAIDRRIRIHSLVIPSIVTPAIATFQMDQCRAVSEPTGGSTSEFGRTDAIEKALINTIRDAAGESNANGDIARRALNGATRADLLCDPSIDQDRVREVFELLGTSNVGDSSNDGIQHASGWCLASTPAGIPNVRKLVWMSRDELDVLLQELMFLQRSLLASKDEYLNTAIKARLEPWSFFAQDQENVSPTTLRSFLENRGIPVCTGILSKSREEFSHLTDEAKQKLRQRLMREIIPRLVTLRNSDLFIDVGGTEMGPIPEEVLP